MAVQSHGASHRKAVHHLRHERGQGVLGHRRHGTQGLRRRQRHAKPRQGLFDGGRKCRLHQRLGLRAGLDGHRDGERNPARRETGLEQERPLHSISYDIPRGAANNGTLTFPSTSCMHMFEVTASSASSTLEISVTDRFGNVSTESMIRPKALTTDVTK